MLYPTELRELVRGKCTGVAAAYPIDRQSWWLRGVNGRGARQP